MSMGLDSPMDALAINYLSQLHGAGGGIAANINYVWAWIAFLTAAAISFWKIKLSSSLIVHSSLHQHLINSPCLSSHQPQTSSSSFADDIDEHQHDEEEEEDLPTASLTSSFSSNLKSSIIRHTAFCSIENRRSGKFSMYYYNDNDEDDNSNNSKPTNLDDIDTTQSKLAHRSHAGCSIRLNNNPPHHEEEKQELSVRRTSISYFGQQQQQEAAAEWEWEPVLLKMKTTEMVWYRYQDLTVLDGNVVCLWN